MDNAAIQNLDFLRQLIAEIRSDQNYDDAAKLRMLQGTGMGLDGIRQEV